MTSSFSGREAWLSFPKVKWNAEGQLKRAVDSALWLSGMPGSKNILSDHEIWSIVVYLRHLPPAGSLAEPKMCSH
jgi:hypothetical protein